MKVIYVGSFNPITKAHKEIADIASRYGDVIFVPVSDYYNKSTLNVSALHRYNMLKLVADTYEVSRIEIDNHRQNKTIETLDSLNEIYHDELLLLIGGDNLKELSKWYKIEELLNKYKVLVVSREESLIDIIESDELLKKYQDRLIIINNIEIAISSKMVRERLKNHQAIDDLVDGRVIEYIKRNKLYE